MGESVDVDALRQKLTDLNMQGSLRMVNFLTGPHAVGLLEFGSSSLGPRSSGRLYFGRPKANPRVTPLADFERSFAEVGKFSPEERAIIDNVVGALADSMTQVKEHPELLKRLKSEADF